MRTYDDLRQLQSLPLSLKVSMTIQRIRDWIYEFGSDGVYISFSGGKDSTVLCDIIDKYDPGNSIPKVFVDTGLEYPEVREFVKTFSNVEIIKPKMQFKKVIEKYGYPFVNKEVAQKVYAIHHTVREGKTYNHLMEQFRGERIDKTTGKKSSYNYPQWMFMLDAPFAISHKCCAVMKKNPAHEYARKTGRKPITGQMAEESLMRRQMWMKHGCNGFDLVIPTSNPMSFWTEQDVLKYIKENNIKIASVYGDIVADTGKDIVAEGQMRIEQFFPEGGECRLKTTGCSRTGCMFCGFGCHRDAPGEGRFLKMKETHPKQYEWIMKPWSEGGLGYKEIIDWMNEHGDLHIEY